MAQQNSYKGFKDLNCWKEARSLRMSISDLVKTMPATEKHQLINQMTRAARSITANIAEGYGRYTYTDTRRFFILARGSATELIDHLSVATDENYINEETHLNLQQHCETVFKLINGYIAYLDNNKKEQQNIA